MRKFCSLPVAALLFAVMLSAGWVSAQEEGAPERRPEATPAERQAETPEDRAATQGQAGQRQDREARYADYWLATCLVIDNQTEAALGQFAQQRAESEEVRQFAEKMAQEHGQMAETLKRFAQPQGGRDEAAPTRDDAAPTRDDAAATRDDAAAAARPAQPRAGQGAGAQQGRGQRAAMFFVSLKKEIADQCLQSAQKELGAKKGEEFDKCYIDSQVMAHQKMVDTLTVFQKHASEEFKATLAQGLETTKGHLEEAKSIAKTLDGKASEQASATQP